MSRPALDVPDEDVSSRIPGRARQLFDLMVVSLRRSAPVGAAAVTFIFLFFTLGTYLFSTFGEMNQQAMGTLSPDLVMAMFGGMVGGFRPVDLWLITLFVHPLLIVMLVTTVTTPAVRDIAGGLDRGTMDLVLGCPVPRWAVPTATWCATQVVLLVLLGSAWSGIQAGARILRADSPEGALLLSAAPAYLPVFGQLWLLGQVILGVVLLVGCASSLQNRATAITVGFVIASYFLNLLAGLWPAVAPARWLSVFHYYQPQPILADASVAVERWVLAVVAAMTVGLAIRVFVRRDLPGA